MKSKVFIGAIILLSACLDTDTISKNERLENEIKKIDDYLTANPPDPTDIVIKDVTGVRLVITQLGTGTIPPNPENNLKVSYVGKFFTDGIVFDSNDAFFFKVSDGIIDGWKIGLSMMTEGAQATFYIPSVYAYGSNGKGSIPGNAILVFDMQLLNVVPTSAQESRLTSDIIAIDTKLDADQVENVVYDESGLRYVLNPIGSGILPSLYSKVRIKYSGKLLTNGSEFLAPIEQGPSSNFNGRVVNYLHGLVIGLQQMHPGDQATFYVPSTLGYGPLGITGVPGNSNLIFEVELLEVINE